MKVLTLRSRVISAADYRSHDFKDSLPAFQPDMARLERELKQLCQDHGTVEQVGSILRGDSAVLHLQSEDTRFQKSQIELTVGKGILHRELEKKLVGLMTGSVTEVMVENIPVTVHVESVTRNVVPELTNSTVKSWKMEGISTVDALRRSLVSVQVKEFREGNEAVDTIVKDIYAEVLENSKVELDAGELDLVRIAIQEQPSAGGAAQCGSGFTGNAEQLLTAAVLGASMYAGGSEETLDQEVVDGIVETVNESANKLFTVLNDFVENILFSRSYEQVLNKLPYDAAIVGAGPAGLSAALNLKLHNKRVIWFGSPELSDKVGKSEKVANYPGIPGVSGKDLNLQFVCQIREADLHLTDRMVTLINRSKSGFMLLADNEIFEARQVLLCTGVVNAKAIPGEDKLLGLGVSYCATCDGFLYAGKTIAVFCGSQRYEHEVEYLAGIAAKVYLFTGYPDCTVSRDNIEKMPGRIASIDGEGRVSGITLTDGTVLPLDGVFLLRNAVAPGTLLQGIAMDGAHIMVDRSQRTNIDGCYAAGDCTGRPYQIAKAVGEGNVAAHAMLENAKE